MRPCSALFICVSLQFIEEADQAEYKTVRKEILEPLWRLVCAAQFLQLIIAVLLVANRSKRSTDRVRQSTKEYEMLLVRLVFQRF